MDIGDIGDLNVQDQRYDQMGKFCTGCGKGTYTETCLDDDRYGILHCSLCGLSIPRWIERP